MAKKLITALTGILCCLGFALSAAACGTKSPTLYNPNGDPSDVENTFPEEDEDEEENNGSLLCKHSFEKGDVVRAGTSYVRELTCVKCGKTLKESVRLIAVSDTYLYDETAHWNHATVTAAGTALPKTRAASKKENEVDVGRTNVDKHDFDEHGVCKGCHYKETPSEGLEYELNEDGDGYIVVGKGECKDEHINIPNKYEDKPVVGIGEGAFKPKSEKPEKPETPDETLPEENPDETLPEETPVEPLPEEEEPVVIGITIPDTVVDISCTAFSDLEKLNNFIVDTANKVFEATDYCLIDKINASLLRGCEYSVIPADGSVTVIGEFAFAGCSTLVSITVPDSIETIKDKAFFECDALVEVKMPESVEIGVDVFRGSIHVEVTVEHDLVFVAPVAATCQKPGNVAHYKCQSEGCTHLYADEEGTDRLYNVETYADHVFEDGSCSVCGKVLEEVTIVSVDEIPHLGKFALGTMEDAIGLPKKINVTTADGASHEVPVNWELSDYKKDTVGEYTIRGHIIPGELHFDEEISSEVQAKIEIVEYMQGTADIVFVLDGTGSMGPFIERVKDNIINFANDLEAKGVSARWSVIDYRDYTQDSSEVTHVVMNGASEWYTTAPEYSEAIDSINVYGGGDAPEVAIDGLMMATTLETRKNARTFYILVTDIDSKPDNNYGVTDLNELADILEDKGVNTSVVAPTYYHEHYGMLADQTGGVKLDVESDFASALLEALAPIIQSEVLA